MSKRKHQSEDEVTLPSALVSTLKGFLQSLDVATLLLEQGNDVAKLLQHLEAGPKQRTRQATEYTDAGEAGEALGIDFSYFKPGYELILKDVPNDTKTLNEHYAYVVEDFQNHHYLGSRQSEARSRTLLDIIFLDRLKSLQDQESHCRLQFNPEKPISVISDTNEKIQGRMDWALNYDLQNPGSILICLEAKRVGLTVYGLPQLLIYMAGVLQSRHDRINQTVWGMVSDAANFQFAFLDDKKKFYKSEPYQWASRQSTILAYIDAIFLDAIQSSPHTTPTKTGNTVLRNYQRYLKTRWQFGEKSEDEAVSDTDPESIVDVFMEKKRIVLRAVGREEAETSEGAEAVGREEAETSEGAEAVSKGEA